MDHSSQAAALPAGQVVSSQTSNVLSLLKGPVWASDLDSLSRQAVLCRPHSHTSQLRAVRSQVSFWSGGWNLQCWPAEAAWSSCLEASPLPFSTLRCSSSTLLLEDKGCLKRFLSKPGHGFTCSSIRFRGPQIPFLLVPRALSEGGEMPRIGSVWLTEDISQPSIC